MPAGFAIPHMSDSIICELFTAIIGARNSPTQEWMSKTNSTPRIALDIWKAGIPNPRGMVTYRRLFAKACNFLSEASEISLTFAGASSDRAWLFTEGIKEQDDFRLFHFPGRLERVAVHFHILPWGKFLGKPDIYHSATWYPLRSGHMQVIGTLVDFVPIRLPEFVPLELVQKQVNWCKWAARHPEARWIAISGQTRNDALELARLNKDQVVSINLCADEDMFSIPPGEEILSTINSLNIQQPYLLCVNTLTLRKNHIRLLEAWETGKFSENGWTLVLVGAADGTSSSREAYKRQVQRSDLVGVSAQAAVGPSLLWLRGSVESITL